MHECNYQRPAGKCWELNVCPLQEQQVFFLANPSLQPQGKVDNKDLSRRGGGGGGLRKGSLYITKGGCLISIWSFGQLFYGKL